MPHIPTRLAPTSGPVPAPPARREYVPPAKRDDEPAVKKQVSVGSLSLRGWEVDPRDVYEHIFGRAPEVHKMTGRLLHAPAKKEDHGRPAGMVQPGTA